MQPSDEDGIKAMGVLSCLLIVVIWCYESPLYTQPFDDGVIRALNVFTV